MHGLRVHGILFDFLAKFVEPLSENFPQGGFTRTTGANHHHTSPLSQLLIQLQGLFDLEKVLKSISVRYPNISSDIDAVHTVCIFVLMHSKIKAKIQS